MYSNRGKGDILYNIYSMIYLQQYTMYSIEKKTLKNELSKSYSKNFMKLYMLYVLFMSINHTYQSCIDFIGI